MSEIAKARARICLPTITTTASRHHHLHYILFWRADGNEGSVLSSSSLREKEAERENGEED
jgi:hypothetical protein